MVCHKPRDSICLSVINHLKYSCWISLCWSDTLLVERSESGISVLVGCFLGAQQHTAGKSKILLQEQLSVLHEMDILYSVLVSNTFESRHAKLLFRRFCQCFKLGNMFRVKTLENCAPLNKYLRMFSSTWWFCLLVCSAMVSCLYRLIGSLEVDLPYWLKRTG